jgi:dihydroorotate dehydrogenase (fumarate)
MPYQVGGITLPDGPFMIAAGVAKTPTATENWLSVAATVSGSHTPFQQDGNEGKLFYPDTIEEVRRLGFGLNSFGMPNVGFQEAARRLGELNTKEPLIASIAGYKPADYHDGVVVFGQLQNVAAIELNFGCPNTDHGEIMSFNQGDLYTVFEGIRSVGVKKPIWAKFSPFSNPNDLRRAALTVNTYPNTIRAVVTMNTFPHAYGGKEGIICGKTRNRGGQSGPAVKPIAHGQVLQFLEYLDSTIDVIGVGGIMSGNEIVEYLDLGAKAVQMASWPFWLGDPKRFMDELTDPNTSGRFLDYLNEHS